MSGLNQRYHRHCLSLKHQYLDMVNPYLINAALVPPPSKKQPSIVGDDHCVMLDQLLDDIHLSSLHTTINIAMLATPHLPNLPPVSTFSLTHATSVFAFTVSSYQSISKTSGRQHLYHLSFVHQPPQRSFRQHGEIQLERPGG
jgi:hypothetical protein